MKKEHVTVGNTSATVLIRGDLEHVKDFDALTASGQGFVGKDETYGMATKRKSTPRWEIFRRALGRRSPTAIVAAARLLPSVRVKLETSHLLNPNYGFRVGVGRWTLFSAPVVSVDRS